MKLSWSELLAIISVVIALLSLFMNFSKFFIDIYDRREKRKIEMAEKLKAKITLTYYRGALNLENKGNSDALIKAIYIGEDDWKKGPLVISSGQEKLYTNVSPGNGILKIEYEDEYSKKYLETPNVKMFQL